MSRRFALAVVAALLQALPLNARAETVRVLTGEHAGFTRLVLDLASPSNAGLSRTDEGYALQFRRSDIRFDLSQAFQSITRARLGTIWVDPQSGVLQLGVACACHARVEHLSGDVLVIDLVDGHAPPGSVWEMRADGSAADPLHSTPGLRPRPRPILVTPLPDLLAMGLPQPSLPLSSDRETLPLRNDLLQGFAQAAAAGLIDPTKTLEEHGGEYSASSQAQLRLGDRPQVSVTTARNAAAPLTAEGANCIGDERLAIEAWGGDQPFAISASSHNAALIGEFDSPDPAAVSDAVRFYLYYGFGAEAAAMLYAFPDFVPDADLYRQMAKLLDGAEAEDRSDMSVFADQAACDGKAALWAAVSVEHPGRLPGLDRAALRRTFSALPPHLRRLLGPRLAEGLMDDGDMTTARSIIDAIDRPPTSGGPAERLVSAELAVREGDPARGEDITRTALPDAGPERANALVTMANAQLAQGKTVDPGLLDDLASLAGEVGDGPEGRELTRTRALAIASTGDFDEAFTLAQPLPPSVKVDLWKMLAASGPDSAILAYAMEPAAAPAGLPRKTRLRLSERLLSLGFPGEALGWAPGRDPDELLVAAGAELLAGNARAALTLIAGDDTMEANAIRARALMQLGELGQAAATYERMGDAEAAAVALWQSQDWSGWLIRAKTAEKQDVSRLLEPWPGFDVAGPTPLAQGKNLVSNAELAAQAIRAVLGAMPTP